MQSETGRRSIWENGQLRVFVGGERLHSRIHSRKCKTKRKRKERRRLRAFLVSGSPSKQNLSAGGGEVESIVQSGPLGGVWTGYCLLSGMPCITVSRALSLGAGRVETHILSSAPLSTGTDRQGGELQLRSLSPRPQPR